jgi:hypothetical protein
VPDTRALHSLAAALRAQHVDYAHAILAVAARTPEQAGARLATAAIIDFVHAMLPYIKFVEANWHERTGCDRCAPHDAPALARALVELCRWLPTLLADHAAAVLRCTARLASDQFLSRIVRLQDASKLELLV